MKPGVNENPPLSEGSLDDRPSDGRAASCLGLLDDENIDRHPETAQQTPQPDGFPDRVADGRLDNQDIDIGAGALL